MKTIHEWSNAFDVLVADYIRINQFGLQGPLAFDEYEKSLFLTKAQDSLVQDIYTGRYTTQSFEQTEEVRRQLDSLVDTAKCVLNTSNTTELKDTFKDTLEHTIYDLPEDCWYIIYEQATYEGNNIKCIDGLVVDVVPCTHDSYQRTINNPFRGPIKKRVLRLDIGALIVELVSKYKIQDYIIKYIKRPEPIILCNLPVELKINGVDTPQPCKLSDLVHQEILDRAVQLALNYRLNTNNKNNAS